MSKRKRSVARGSFVGALPQHRLGQGEAEKRRRMRRRSFDIAAIRRREIERHAKHVGAAETEDLERWLIAWVWHNGKAKDQIWSVMECARNMGRKISEKDASEIIEASITRKHLSADNLARFLGVTFEQRRRLGLTTIGSIDVKKRARKELRRRRNRRAHEQRRRANGVRPRAEYRATSRTAIKPWEAAGMSRRTWYRKTSAAMAAAMAAKAAAAPARAAAAVAAKDGAVPLGTSPSAAIPTLTECAENGTSPSAALFLSPADTPVPPERKQGDFREGDCPKGTAQTASPTSLVLENGVLLTRRWIAARERLCGCRHNGRLYPQACQKEAAEWHQAITEKQPDAADAVPDQAEKAPPAQPDQPVSAPDPVATDSLPPRPKGMPDGDYGRMLQRFRNQKAVEQFDAAMKARLH
jgi:hypothetical protein